MLVSEIEYDRVDMEICHPLRSNFDHNKRLNLFKKLSEQSVVLCKVQYRRVVK